MPQVHQKTLGELAVTALSGELGAPNAMDVAAGLGFVWKGQRAGRPLLTVYLFFEPEGGRYPARLLIGDPSRAEGEMFTNIIMQDPADIAGIVADIHRRMNGA